MSLGFSATDTTGGEFGVVAWDRTVMVLLVLVPEPYHARGFMITLYLSIMFQNIWVARQPLKMGPSPQKKHVEQQRSGISEKYKHKDVTLALLSLVLP